MDVTSEVEYSTTSKYFDQKPSKSDRSDVLFEIDGHIIHRSDIKCLREDEFVNDTIINFYLEYQWRQLPEKQRKKIHIFSSFFWPKLSLKTRSLEERYQGLIKWTKNVDLFEKDFIIVPIIEHFHWYLAIICFPNLGGPKYTKVKEPKVDHIHRQNHDIAAGSISDSQNQDEKSNGKKKERLVCEPRIIILDSLSNGKANETTQLLRDYLTLEWKTRKPSPRFEKKIFVGLKEWHGAGNKSHLAGIRGHYPRSPQQSNYSDCGIFLLEYAERFMKAGLPRWKRLKNGKWDFGEKVCGDLADWFPATRGRDKRQEILQLINELAKEYKDEDSVAVCKKRPRLA